MKTILFLFGVAFTGFLSSQTLTSLRIPVSANNNEFYIDVDPTTFTLLGAAESFCRQNAETLGITSLDSLIIGCVPQVIDVIRRELEGKVESIPRGDLSPESQEWIARNEKAAAAEVSTAGSASDAQVAQPNYFEVNLVVDKKPFTIAMDLNRFTLLATAETFCRQSAGDLGITTMDMLVNSCIEQVANFINSELGKRYDPSSIPLGRLSDETLAWIESVRTQVPQDGTGTPVVREPPAENMEISFTANEKPYVIVVNLSRFTLLASAEDFCRQKAAELGIDSLETLVTRCIPSVAEVIRDNLARSFDPMTIPIGDISPESAQWLQQQQALEQQKYIFEIQVPIEGREYTVKFDRRTTSPTLAAEKLCDSRDLGIKSIKLLINVCVPQVAALIKQSVDAVIAPETIALGDNSVAVKRIIASGLADEEVAAAV